MRDAEAGKYNDEYTYCPVNCWTEEDCPYAHDGICHIDDPVADCDDFATFFGSWNEWISAG